MVNDLIWTGSDRIVGDHTCLLVEAVRAVHRAAIVGKDILKCCDRLCKCELYSEVVDFLHLVEIRERFFDAECCVCRIDPMAPTLNVFQAHIGIKLNTVCKICVIAQAESPLGTVIVVFPGFCKPRIDHTAVVCCESFPYISAFPAVIRIAASLHSITRSRDDNLICLVFLCVFHCLCCGFCLSCSRCLRCSSFCFCRLSRAVIRAASASGNYGCRHCCR